MGTVPEPAAPPVTCICTLPSGPVLMVPPVGKEETL